MSGERKKNINSSPYHTNKSLILDKKYTEYLSKLQIQSPKF